MFSSKYGLSLYLNNEILNLKKLKGTQNLKDMLHLNFRHFKLKSA